MTPRTPQQVLDAALAVLEERGWIQGKYVDWRGRMCVVEAINFVGMPAEIEPALNELSRRVHDNPCYWNDHIAKDFSEVRAVMKGAQR